MGACRVILIFYVTLCLPMSLEANLFQIPSEQLEYHPDYVTGGEYVSLKNQFKIWKTQKKGASKQLKEVSVHILTKGAIENG